MPLKWTSVETILEVAPRIGSNTNVVSAHIFRFAAHAEAEVEATIGQRYVLPISATLPSGNLLESVATDLAIHKILSRRVFTTEVLKDSEWPDRFKEARETLINIRRGRLFLVDSAGVLLAQRNDLDEVWSNTQDYQPTFSDLPMTESEVDPDKVEDLRDDRDIALPRFIK